LRQRRTTCAALLVGLLMPCALGADSANEYEVKAAFLYNFTKFVEWPEGPANTSFCIGIAGEDPFGAALDAVVKGRSVGGHPLVIQRFKTGQESVCQIVFISASEKKRLHAILDRFQGSAVLTVGDMPGFCGGGGVVGLELGDNRVRLRINMEAAQRAHLQLSSKLLSLATLVHDGGN
jgi:hypothetical protein